MNGISDLDWKEICDKYSIKCHYDSLRKASQTIFGGYFVNEYYKYKNVSENSDNEYIEKIETKKRELMEERQKLIATKNEYIREIRHKSRFELFYQNIADMITTLPLPEFHTEHISNNNKEEYVLGIGDIHYGAAFKSINNTYSTKICKDRFQYLLCYMADFVVKNNLSKISIVNVADSIQGILRLSDLKMNETEVVMCVVEIAQIISEFLNKLSSFCKINYYHVTHANHSQTRNLGSKASELASEDLEKIIANYIHDVLADNENVNVIFDTEKEYIDFDIFGFHCTAEHGHRIKNINDYLKDKSILRRKMYSYAFLGHTHSSQEVIVGEERNNNIECLVVPSFIGSDPYADTLNVGAKAMCKIYKFNDKFGHVASENIILN